MTQKEIFNNRFEVLKDRLISKVKDLSFLTDEDCWQMSVVNKRDGYGRIYFLGDKHTAHRISFFIFKDFCASNLLNEPWIEICHTCDNRACINPNHLFKGTKSDNMKDCFNKGRSGGLFKSKFSKETIKQIQERLAEGIQQKLIAKEFNISPSYLSQIKHGYFN